MADSDVISPEQVRLVRSVSRALARTSDLDALLLQIAKAARDMLNCERASIFLHDAKTGEFWTKIALDNPEIRVPEKTGIVGAAFWNNQLIDVPDPYSDERFNRANDQRMGFRTRNIIAGPVSGADGKPLGVLQVINKTGGCFSADDRSMVELLSDQAGVAIQRHRYMVEAVRVASLEKEMDLARRVQEAMIPKHPPKIPGIEVAGWTKPASTTGGDVFDLWPTRDGRLGIFLGDASGHGLAPTLVVSQCRTLVRALAEIDTDPLLLLSRINARMAGDLENGRFVTCFVGFMSPDGQLDYCSAGHGPLVVRDAGHSPLRLLHPSLPPIGVLDEMPQDRAEAMKLEPGGSFVILSDGIFEARDSNGELFGIEQVCDVLEQQRDYAPRHMIAHLFKLAREWQGQDDPADDQTIVILRPTNVTHHATPPVDEA